MILSSSIKHPKPKILSHAHDYQFILIIQKKKKKQLQHGQQFQAVNSVIHLVQKTVAESLQL